MPSKGRPQAHRARRPRASSNKPKSINIVSSRSRSRNFDSLTPRQQDTYTRAIPVLGKVRRGASLYEAATESGTTVETVLRYFPRDFTKIKGSRRWVVSKSDRHVRFMKDVGDFGMRVVRVRGAVEATQQSLFMNDVRRSLAKNDPSVLSKWHGKRIGDRELITSMRKIMTFAESGDLSFEDLYSAVME